MTVAFVDSSWMVAQALGERGHRQRRKRLAAFDRVYASGLLEAELASALLREGLGLAPLPLLLRGLRWVFPGRPLQVEIARVLEHGYLRGADLWHLACALFLAPDPPELSFLTLDQTQAKVAKALGFTTGS